MSKISKVGIIANPNSGKDIRRLVGYGSIYDNAEKTEIIKRVLIGLHSTGINEIFFMPDIFGFSSSAISGLYKKDYDNLKGKVKNIEMDITGTKEDSIVAGAIMNKMGIDCIIVLGGDGTSRAVATSCGSTPLLPISTGTNNVFPLKIEGTLAGIVAGIYSTNNFDKNKVLDKMKYLKLYINGKFEGISLVDLVVYDDPFIATKALWKPGKIKYVAVTSADIGNIGISSIVSNFITITKTEECGLYCITNGKDLKFEVKAILVPGMICDIPIKKYGFLELDKKVRIKIEDEYKWVTIALDGEREYEVNLERDIMEIELKYGKVLLLNPNKILEEAISKKLLIKKLIQTDKLYF